MGASMRISGDRKVSRRFKDLSNNAQDVEKVWPKVGSYMSREVHKQFVSEGRHFGTPWKPLKPATVLEKRRLGYGRKILLRTKELRSSWTGRPMDIEEYRGNTAVFGSSNQKAIWHQYGTRNKNGTRVNPPRQMLKVTPQMAADIRKMIADHIMGRQRP